MPVLTSLLDVSYVGSEGGRERRSHEFTQVLGRPASALIFTFS